VPFVAIWESPLPGKGSGPYTTSPSDMRRRSSTFPEAVLQAREIPEASAAMSRSETYGTDPAPVMRSHTIAPVAELIRRRRRAVPAESTYSTSPPGSARIVESLVVKRSGPHRISRCRRKSRNSPCSSRGNTP
jgi:hypothetical protein